ncbi:MAG: ATP phosphoribosyltransferase regulatory subunit, partial [Clostridia bacterium]
LDDFQIELGHIGFFKGFLSALNLSVDQTDEIVDLVEKKDAIGEELWAKRVGLSSENLQLITRLPMLFGGSEVLEDARSLCLNDEMLCALDNLNAIYDGLKNLGLDNFISFDLSIVGKMKYYSGLVIKGISKYCGRAILSGGRYDNLCDSFGKHINAVGFAISIGYVLSTLQSQGNLPCDTRAQVVVGACKQKFGDLDNFAKQLESSGVRVVKTFATTIAELEKEKQNCGVKRALFLTQDGATMEV